MHVEQQKVWTRLPQEGFFSKNAINVQNKCYKSELVLGKFQDEIVSDSFRFQIGISDGKFFPFRFRGNQFSIGISDFSFPISNTAGNGDPIPISYHVTKSF